MGLCGGFTATSNVTAQNPAYQLTVTTSMGNTNETASIEVLLDHGGDPVEGWSYGACHDPAELTLLGAAAGAVPLTAKNGAPIDFQSLDLFPSGFTAGGIICFLGCASLSPGLGYQLNTAQYQIHGLAPATAAVEFCSTLGAPPVDVSVVTDGGFNQVPVQTPGGVQIVGPPPRYYRFASEGVVVPYDPGSGLASSSTALTIIELPTNPTFPNPIAAFSMSTTFPSAYMLVTSVTPGPQLAALQGGAGPDFFQAQIGATAITVDVVTAAAPVNQLTANTLARVVDVDFDSNPTNLLFNSFGVTVGFGWQSGLGSPPVENELSSTGLVVGLLFQNGLVQFVPRETFRRGDANDDGSVDIADALRVLAILFNSSPVVCPAASDANDSGATDIADAVTLLDFLFNGGANFPPPFPGCGDDTTGPAPSCPNFASCP